MVMVRSMNLVLMVIVWSMLRNQENRKTKSCLNLKNCQSQENQKAKNRLGPKNCQKIGIHLISVL